MKLYHASTLCIKKPDVLHSRDKLDFGRGFYMTSIREQAIRYAERFTRKGKEAFINEYENLVSKRHRENVAPRHLA